MKQRGSILPSEKRKKKLGEEQLQRIIDLCKSIEERSLDPFLVDVDDILQIIREHFPEWKSLEEFSLDAEAINRLASVIKLQSDWVRHRSTSLYTDPFLLEEKILKLDKEELVDFFLRAWHPIVELEQISPYSLARALEYWRGLVPLNERWLKTQVVETELGVTSREELIRQSLLLEKAFTEELEALWEELKGKVGEDGRIGYWDFVGMDSYEETVRRAYMTSFLVTYGYATLEVYRLEEEMYIRPFEKPVSLVGKKQMVSVPVSLSSEEWRRWKSRQQG
jgi:hypothetical protein